MRKVIKKSDLTKKEAFTSTDDKSILSKESIKTKASYFDKVCT